VTAEPPEYKYWKRDDLKPAIAEVNAVSDIEIAVVEKRVGRKVVSLHFTTKMRPQESLEFPPPPLMDASVREPIMAMGLSQKDTDELLRNYDAVQLRAAIEAMKDRLKNTRLPQITSRRAYLKSILKNGLPETLAAPATTAAKQEKVADPSAQLREEYESRRRREAKALLQEMEDTDVDAVFSEFLETAAPGMRTVMRKAGPLAPLANAFHLWFAEKTWGPATDADLLKFAAERVAQAEAIRPA
jgi:hypothetical protein